jgi:hypothetical protein
MGIAAVWRHFRASRKLAADVLKHGWHVVKVSGDDEGPGFAYSVGLFRTLGHPEIIMFGLPGDWLHQHINTIGAAVRGGVRFAPGNRVADVLENHECVFVAVPRARYADHVGQAIAYYGNADFPLLQCVWPDRYSRYPWDADYPDDLREEQPVLGHLPGHGNGSQSAGQQ